MTGSSEPFLTDYAVTFHRVFTLLDPTMNTSEVNPIHLSLPRGRNSRIPADKPKPEEPAANGGRPLQQAAKAKPNGAPVQPAVVDRAPSRVSPAADASGEQPAKSKAQSDLAEDFWLYPSPPSSALHFIFQIDSSSSPWTFKLLSDSGNKVLLSAVMNGRARAAGIRISAREQEIGEGKWDAAGNAFFCAVAIGTERSEACCAMYGERGFDLIVPGIKKFDGRPRMCQILSADGSALLQRASKGAKDAIRLKSRDVNDLTFGGAFEQSAPGNFQLFHDSNARKTICAFGLKTSGAYELTVSYPLSPVQGFLAGISATIP
jgi:hypothetical protein